MNSHNKNQSKVNIADYNAHWTETVRNMNEQMNSVVSPFQSPKLKKILEGLSTPSMRKLVSEQLSVSSLAAKAMIDNQSIISKLALAKPAFSETVRKLAEANQVSFDDHRQSWIEKTRESITSSLKTSVFQIPKLDIDSHLKNYAELTQFSSLAKVQADAMKSASQVRGLKSFQALAKLDNSPFAKGTEYCLPKVEPSYTNDVNVEEFDEQIKKEIATVSDFNALSDVTKGKLTYLYHQYILPILLGIISGIISGLVVSNVTLAKNELAEMKSASEVRKFARSASDFVDVSLLNGYRVTTADKLNLRSRPGMNTEIITTLPIGTLVEVVDKSNRAWLLVAIEIEGEVLQGYVSRRYTTYFK